MSRTDAHAVMEAQVVSLVYELLDAHADTVALAAEPPDQLGWEIHVDYLRALQRKTREILASWHEGSEAIEPK